MERNSWTLPLAALGLALLGLVLTAFSLDWPGRLLKREAEAGIDGRITGGEYGHGFVASDFGLEFHWRVEGDELVGAVRSAEHGWVAVGFGGEGPLMQGADVVIGYVGPEGAHVSDDFAFGMTEHAPDTAIGGSDDLIAWAGHEGPEGTTIEFRRRLAAMDTLDVAVADTTLRLLLASSEDDDFMAYHATGKKALAEINIVRPPPALAEPTAPWIPERLEDHEIALLAWTAVLFLFGVQGVLSVLLEGKEIGERTGRPAPEPVWAVRSAVLIAVVELYLVIRLFVGIANERATARTLGLTMSAILVLLAALLVIYRVGFLSEEVVEQSRDEEVPW